MQVLFVENEHLNELIGSNLRGIDELRITIRDLEIHRQKSIDSEDKAGFHSGEAKRLNNILVERMKKIEQLRNRAAFLEKSGSNLAESNCQIQALTTEKERLT